MRDVAYIVLAYTVIAGIATLANLCTQALSMYAYAGGHAVTLSIALGTLVGLPLKYVLEKRFVFRFKSRTLGHDSQLFFIYSFMGVFTTALFWLVEYTFHLIFASEAMRYLGGALGLTAGYAIKYQLDKRFVFLPQRSASPARIHETPRLG